MITELNGLASPNGNQPQLVEAAQAALAYVSSHLNIRTEEIDFSFNGSDGAESKGRNIDDMIQEVNGFR